MPWCHVVWLPESKSLMKQPLMLVSLIGYAINQCVSWANMYIYIYMYHSQKLIGWIRKHQSFGCGLNLFTRTFGLFHGIQTKPYGSIGTYQCDSPINANLQCTTAHVVFLTCNKDMQKHTYHIWLVVYLPLWKMMESVSWGYYSQLMKAMFQTTNQITIIFPLLLVYSPKIFHYQPSLLTNISNQL